MPKREPEERCYDLAYDWIADEDDESDKDEPSNEADVKSLACAIEDAISKWCYEHNYFTDEERAAMDQLKDMNF